MPDYVRCHDRIEVPQPDEAVYGASKAFELSWAQAVRNELKDSGVTVTALQPGPTDTQFFHRAGMDNTKVGADQKDDPALAHMRRGMSEPGTASK